MKFSASFVALFLTLVQSGVINAVPVSTSDASLMRRTREQECRNQCVAQGLIGPHLTQCIRECMGLTPPPSPQNKAKKSGKRDLVEVELDAREEFSLERRTREQECRNQCVAQGLIGPHLTQCIRECMGLTPPPSPQNKAKKSGKRDLTEVELDAREEDSFLERRTREQECRNQCVAQGLIGPHLTQCIRECMGLTPPPSPQNKAKKSGKRDLEEVELDAREEEFYLERRTREQECRNQCVAQGLIGPHLTQCIRECMGLTPPPSPQNKAKKSGKRDLDEVELDAREEEFYLERRTREQECRNQCVAQGLIGPHLTQCIRECMGLTPPPSPQNKAKKSGKRDLVEVELDAREEEFYLERRTREQECRNQCVAQGLIGPHLTQCIRECMGLTPPPSPQNKAKKSGKRELVEFFDIEN